MKTASTVCDDCVLLSQGKRLTAVNRPDYAQGREDPYPCRLMPLDYFQAFAKKTPVSSTSSP